MRTLLIGRWQPLHLGHLKIVQEAAKKGEVIIAIGSAQESNTIKNPFSASERIQMWREALNPLDIHPVFVNLPDFPNNNELWVQNLLKTCPHFDRIITGDPLSHKLLSNAGLDVEMPKFYNEDELKGTKVRDLMAKADSSWKKLVPTPVVEYIKKIDGEGRVKKLAEKGRRSQV